MLMFIMTKTLIITTKLTSETEAEARLTSVAMKCFERLVMADINDG